MAARMCDICQIASFTLRKILFLAFQTIKASEIIPLK